MCDNKTINFPQVDPDTQLEQMLNSPTQRARREARRKEDKLWENTNRFIHSAALFSAGIVFLWVLREILGY